MAVSAAATKAPAGPPATKPPVAAPTVAAAVARGPPIATKNAEKCTFCYHRIVNGKLPACVEVCPTQARVFGELHTKASPLVRFKRMNKISVLKPALNTEPKVFYANLDMEVK